MRRRLLSVVLALSFLCGMLSHAEASTENTAVLLSAYIAGERIDAIEADNGIYLLLPAEADTENLIFHVSPAAIVCGENEDVVTSPVNLNTKAKVYGTGYRLYVKTNEEKIPLYIMHGERIPTVYLHSDNEVENREWVDASKEHAASGSINFVSANGDTIYDGALTQIKARGNSTFRSYPKKAYQIKLNQKADLLGNGEKVKTWVLLANYGDATMQHDKLIKDLSTALDMPYAVSCDWVNLYYDGIYRGVYLLSEKIAVNSTGVDINDMEEDYKKLNHSYGENIKVAESENKYGQKYLYTDNLTEPENTTGGYLIERNLNFIDEANGFYTTKGAAFNIKSPEYAGKEAVDYISTYYQDFENAVFASDENGNYTGYNPVTKKYYDEYVDLTSLIQVFLIQELSLNPDGFKSSFFFYKDIDNKMYAGPVWDHDISMGTGWSKYNSPQIVSYLYLESGLIKIPSFRAALEEYFTTTFLPEAEKIIAHNGEIDRFTGILNANAEMNYVLWPYVRIGDPQNTGHLWADGTNYDAVTRDLKLWLTKRINVLKELYYNDAYAVHFKDVSDTSWMYPAICYSYGHGWLRGVSENCFAPDMQVGQGTMFTLLARFYGQDTSPVSGEMWQQPGMRWAKECGLLFSDDSNEPVTREKLADALYKIAKVDHINDDLSDFIDADAVSDWARPAMCWAVSNGLLTGDNSHRLMPQQNVTRAQLAQIIMNMQRGKTIN